MDAYVRLMLVKEMQAAEMRRAQNERLSRPTRRRDAHPRSIRSVIRLVLRPSTAG